LVFSIKRDYRKARFAAYWELHQAKRIGLSLSFIWLFVHYRYHYFPQRLDDFFGIILIGTHVTLLIGTFILLYRALINLFRGWDHFKASPDADKFRLKLERLGHDGNEGMFGENGSVNKKH